MRGTDLHPAAWIVWATCAGLTAFVTTDPLYLVLIVAVSWFVYAAHHTRAPSARSFRVFLIAGAVALVLRTSLALLGWIVPSIGVVSSGSVAFAFLEGLRLAAILVVFGTFNAVTDPFGLVRMTPRRFHEPALAAALALSIAPRTIASAGDVREAQRLRGLPVTGIRSLPALAVPVLERGMEEASTLAESMDARGHGRGRRSRYRAQRWSAPALAVAATSLMAAALFLVASLGGWGGLHPATVPIAWPQADPILLVAIALLATPGIVPTGGTA
jgi:energy-coupling factor transport system permease protein